MYPHRKDVSGTTKCGWKNVKAVEMILEDKDEELESPSSSTLSFTLSSPSSPLRTGVNAWTLVTGRQPDVKIHVGGVCFQLHKDILITKSGYLRRHLNRTTELILSPPLKLSAETFKQVADFWYTNHVAVTPTNVAELLTASELLETNDDSGDSLREITESYLRNLLLHNNKDTCTVFMSTLSLLPEAELTACIPSRCLEVMFEAGGGGCADGLKLVSLVNFRVVVESMQRRFSNSHDILYRLADLYFQVHEGKTLSEEQKTQISSCIDCSIVSAPLLMHAVQNPRMPLRFVVQAMFTAHRSLSSAINETKCCPRPPAESSATLRVFLERDAALRQADEMREAVEMTCSRIQILEKEISWMKKLLDDRQEDDRGKSASCRFDNSNNRKVERGERGSVSASMVRLYRGTVNSRNNRVDESLSWSLSSYLQSNEHRKSPKANVKTGFKQRLIRGLKKTFRVDNNKMKKQETECNENDMSGL